MCEEILKVMSYPLRLLLGDTIHDKTDWNANLSKAKRPSPVTNNTMVGRVIQ